MKSFSLSFLLLLSPYSLPSFFPRKQKGSRVVASSEWSEKRSLHGFSNSRNPTFCWTIEPQLVMVIFCVVKKLEKKS
jgi:hypothetical protein